MADRLDNPIDKRQWFFRRSSGGGDGFGRFAEAPARFLGPPPLVPLRRGDTGILKSPLHLPLVQQHRINLLRVYSHHAAHG